MAGRFGGLHISLPGLGTILLRPSATTTRTPITSSNLPPINQVSLCDNTFFFSFFFFFTLGIFHYFVSLLFIMDGLTS
jgi:hypothetical protein